MKTIYRFRRIDQARVEKQYLRATAIAVSRLSFDAMHHNATESDPRCGPSATAFKPHNALEATVALFKMERFLFLYSQILHF